MDENSDDITKDGVRTVPLSSWQEFHQQALSLKSRRGYVWRGQKKDWPLLSSFDRQLPQSMRQDQRARDRKLKEHLNNFKEAMNKSYPNVLPPNDDDIWALGQQYGLKTPLLDWTKSPDIAAYFAFIEGIDQNDRNDCHRYVYALKRRIEQLVLKQKKGNKTLSRDRFVDFIDELPHPNPRVTAQEGTFTKVLRGRDIQEVIEKFLARRGNEILLVKFKIPTKDRDQCLHNLHSMDIDHTSLLLDLHNVVDGCNSRLRSPRRFGFATSSCAQ